MEKINVELTSIQYWALYGMVLEYVRAAPAQGWPDKWNDALTDETATVGDVFCVIAAACDQAARQACDVGRQGAARAAAGDAAGDQVPK